MLELFSTVIFVSGTQFFIERLVLSVGDLNHIPLHTFIHSLFCDPPDGILYNYCLLLKYYTNMLAAAALPGPTTINRDCVFTSPAIR